MKKCESAEMYEIRKAGSISARLGMESKGRGEGQNSFVIIF
ncbi:MAG: hypothetical protein ACYSUY_05105 [Planctomycetota bacterium]